MKKQHLRLGAAALCAALALTGCAGPEGAVSSAAAADVPAAAVAYVPLDDRPVNTDRVTYLAESLHLTLRMPAETLYRTQLDGQENNPDGTRYGDRAGLYEWVLAQESSGCNYYILSLDQLLSGGLVNSRSFTGGDVTLSDGTVLTEDALLQSLLRTLGSDPDNRVYLLDTVMRLAPTVGYDGFDLAGYQALRAYGMLARPALSGGDLTLDNIAAAYPLTADGAAAETTLSDGVIAQYLACRTRKLRLTDEALRLTEGMDNVSFLIGVDDSAPSASIQTNELAYLRRAVGDRGALLSGADEDGMLAVCRLYAEQFCTGPLPDVTVRYFGGSEGNASSDYDHQPLTEIVDAHLRYLGLERQDSPGGNGELQLLVLTAPAKAEPASDSIGKIITALRENEKNGTPTILMDASKNGYGTAFQTALIGRTQLGFLLGYAGYYDLANVTGIALSCGVARYLCLGEQPERSAAQEAAFSRTLADSLLKDLCYKSVTKGKLTAYVRDELQGDPDNFAATGTDPDAALSWLRSTLPGDCRDVLDNLSHSNRLTGLNPGDKPAGWGAVSIADVALPWERVFEIRLSLDVNDLTKIHKKFLFFNVS